MRDLQRAEARGPEPLPLVLLADEQADYRTSIAFHLALAGYPVVEAGSMSAMVAGFQGVRPDLMVVSDGFGGGDIADLLDSIRDYPDLGDVPVITVSSAPGNERLAACLAGGARDHVRRQDGADALVARVDAVLRADDELERLRRRNAELEFLGATDPLTGFGNRRRIEEEYERLAAGAQRHGHPLSVAMVRVDDLPDPGGPDTLRRRRDAVVRELGYLISAVRRAEDFAGVWDDATFALLLPMTSLEGALAFVRRLRTVVQAAPVANGDERVDVTLSAGCAEHSPLAHALLHRLEQSVLAVQAGGGDSIAVAG